MRSKTTTLTLALAITLSGTATTAWGGGSGKTITFAHDLAPLMGTYKLVGGDVNNETCDDHDEMQVIDACDDQGADPGCVRGQNIANSEWETIKTGSSVKPLGWTPIVRDPSEPKDDWYGFRGYFAPKPGFITMATFIREGKIYESTQYAWWTLGKVGSRLVMTLGVRLYNKHGGSKVSTTTCIYEPVKNDGVKPVPAKTDVAEDAAVKVVPAPPAVAAQASTTATQQRLN